MIAYSDYQFYTDKYKGSTIPEPAFDEFALKATAVIDYMTFNRITDITDDIKMATCAAAEAGYKYASKEDIVSETVGKASVHYGGGKTSLNRKMREAALVYLSGSNLLNRQCMLWGG